MRNQRVLLVISVLFVICLNSPARTGDSVMMEGLRQIMDKHEVRTSDRARERIRRAGEPRFSFVQLADVHHRTGGEKKNKWLYRALTYINSELSPAFVVFSGDNISGDSVKHQKQFKSLIGSRLDVPVHLIRGDNDEEHFHRVFGSSKWSFDYGGVHFMGTAIDVDEAPGKGTGYFSTDTIDWMKEDLKRSNQPSVVFLHENIWPATFADAPRFAHILRSDTGVLFLATGHLHRDLETGVNGLSQIVAPSVRKSSHHGFKEYRVYREKLVIVTHDARGGSYGIAPKFQDLTLDSPLPGNDRELEKTNQDRLPPQEMEYAEELGWYRNRVKSSLLSELLRTFWNGKDQNK